MGAPLERDALPRRAPHVPWPDWRHEPARALPWVAEGPRRVRGDLGGWPVEERRRGDHHGAAPEEAFHGPEGAEVKSCGLVPPDAFLSVRGCRSSRLRSQIHCDGAPGGVRQLHVVCSAPTACTEWLRPLRVQTESQTQSSYAKFLFGATVVVVACFGVRPRSESLLLGGTSAP